MKERRRFKQTKINEHCEVGDRKMNGPRFR